ncbi:putative bifunctional diguanylate cyclase/phosphodiesterase [Devosia sp.]|uniref:putative bifunctional diguanylate cyclase/phosphodiesterase n=1 Tax=Devosia sp. TaxID=1871048 RepID=UPI003A934356
MKKLLLTGDSIEMTSAMLGFIRRNFISSMMINLAASIGTALVAPREVTPWIDWWLAAVLALTLVRIVLHYKVPPHAPGDHARNQLCLRISAAGTLAAAMLWVAVAWPLVGADAPEVRYTTSIIIGGMAAGASGVLAPYRWIGPLYILILIIPPALRMTPHEGADAMVGGLAVMYALVMIVTQRSSRAQLRNSVLLSQENSALLTKVLDANQTLEKRVAERTETLRQMALHDQLTGAMNRRGLESVFAALSPDQAPVLIYFLDLNRFKRINDTLGHEAGDELLIEVARRLRTALPADATVARWGGDEFVCIVPNTADTKGLDAAISVAFAEHFSFNRLELDVSASVGRALMPQDGTTLETLVGCADLAGTEAKRLGLTTPLHYEPQLATAMHRRDTIADDLATAIKADQLWLAFQPIVNATTGKLQHFEALLRWTHPVLGELMPDEFIPIAEQTNQIQEIGNWVLDRACAAAADWQRQGVEAGVAVNFSIKQLLDRSVLELAALSLDRHGLAPASLQIEVTESVFHPSSDAPVLDILCRIDAMGICLAIDDFGTGYSSLSRLRDYPIRQLKIDRSFICDIGGKSRTVIEGAVLIARRFELTVIAEGVETSEQVEALRALGVDSLQGYLIGRPSPDPIVPEFHLPPVGLAKRAS